MGNCKSVGKGAVIKSTGKGRRKLTLAILGLDNAGKTITANGLKGEIIQDVAPTIGFSNVEFAFGKFDIVLFDLGGGNRIRGIWKDYFAEVYGVVYVIDSTDEERIEECKKTLHEMIENPKIQGKPLLILANKQDQPGALDEIDICEKLQLEQVVNYNRCPSRVETCSAINAKGKKIDPGITNGFQWLLDTIMNSIEKLDLRVTEDMEEQKRIQEKEKAERKERVRRVREERERKEAAERVRQGLPPNPDDDEDDMDGKINGDPFKSIQDTIKSNEAKLDASLGHKKLGKIRGSKHYTADDDDDEETDIPPPSVLGGSRNRSRRFSDPDMLSSKKLFSDDRFKSKDPDMTLSQSALKLSLTSNNSNSLSARDRYSKTTYDSPRPDRKDRNLSGKLNHISNDSDEEGITSSRSLGHIGNDRSSSPPSYHTNRFGTSRNPLGFDEDVLAPRKPVGHLAPLQPIESYDKKKKKKNRFGKRNQTFPENSDREDTYGEDADIRAVSGLDNPHKSTPRNWAVTSNLQSSTKASRSPRLDPVAEPDEDTTSYGNRWNLADELPELPPQPKSRLRQRKGLDYDNILV